MLTEEIHMVKDLKFAYIRDPYNKKRVITIGWDFPDTADPSTLCYSLAVNKVVNSEEFELDSRLSLLLPASEFRALRKAMRKRFGSESHCRSTARNEIVKRMTDGICWYVEVNQGCPVVLQIMQDFTEYDILDDTPKFMQHAVRVFNEVLNSRQTVATPTFFERFSKFFTG
jgi:hypothetical protein